MISNEHQKLAARLGSILWRLNNGEKLSGADLAEEFNVNPRTIARDFSERLIDLPLEKTPEGKWALPASYLGKLQFSDVQQFAALLGVRDMFPALDEQFFRDLLGRVLTKTLAVHPPGYEDLRGRQPGFKALQRAIDQHCLVSFRYQKGEVQKPVKVAPYRLVNHKGIWYLAATDAGKPKSYAFSKIRSLLVQEETFTPDPAIIKMLDEEDSIWLNREKVEVVLSVAPYAADYFRRSPQIPQQDITKELENGGLIVSGKFAHPDEILPIVRSWIPHIRIIAPKDWQQDMEAGLRTYLDN
jgi:predicted DNA-binding transcriptional regulator YafY